MTAHIMVVDPAAHTPELACFNRMAKTSPLPLTYHLPALQGMGSLAADESGACGVVIFGSASSVHDDLAWRQPLADWVLSKLRAGMPIFGICYGHQLIAHLLGGRVEFHSADRHKRVGFETVTLADDPLWGDARDVSLYVSHREVVTACPAEMRPIASRPGMPFDALAHRSLPVWTLQAHPEATPGFGSGIAAEPSQFIDGHRLVEAFLERAAFCKDTR